MSDRLVKRCSGFTVSSCHRNTHTEGYSVTYSTSPLTITSTTHLPLTDTLSVLGQIMLTNCRWEKKTKNGLAHGNMCDSVLAEEVHITSTKYTLDSLEQLCHNVLGYLYFNNVFWLKLLKKLCMAKRFLHNRKKKELLTY